MKTEFGQEMDIRDWIERKPIDPNPELIYVKEPNGFSAAKIIKYPTNEEIEQVRNWKNRVIEIRDRYKGNELYNTWDHEAKRIVEFLIKFDE